MDAALLVVSDMMVSAEFGLDGIPKEPLVTIRAVTREQKEGEKKKWGILEFVEPWAKPLKVNRHMQACCIAMFGKETDAWIGKRLALYAQPGTYFGKQGTAVRLRGSPDISAPLSVQVKKRGSKNPDVYNLTPTGGGRPSSGPAPSQPAPKKSAPPKDQTPAASSAPAPATDQNQAKPQEPPTPASPPAGSPPADPPPPKLDPKVVGPLFGFGPHKGSPVERAEKSAILATIQFGEEKIAADPNAKWAAQVREEIATLRLELERRMKIGASSTPPAGASREPGSDDGDEGAPPWLS